MLPKDKRLNLKKDFKWVASGKKIETNYLKLFVEYGQNIDPKVGIATSSKIFKKAVERNRARRLTSAAVEKIYESLPTNLNIIALPKAGVLDVKLKNVLFDLEEGLKRITKNEK